MTNWLLYIYCFSLPYQAITIGGIAIVKITGLLLSGWLAVELGFRKFNKSDLTAVLIVSMAPLYLFIGELIRTSAADAINFYMPFISNVLLFILMILSSHALNFRRALTVLVASSFIVPAVMISPFADIGEDGRVSALGLNANFSALLLSLSFIYLSIFARRQRTDLSSLTMYLLAVIPFLGVISTGTRFGLIVCAFFVFFVLYRAAASRFGSLLAILSTGLMMLIGVYIAMSSNLVVVTRFMELSETITTQGRIVLWGLALDAVDSNYTFGVGPNAFNSYIVPIMGSFMSPHNVFFEFYIYGGLIGTLLSIPILYLAMAGIRNKSRTNRDGDLVYFSSIILVVIFNLHHIVFNKLFWFLLAFVYRACHELKLSYETNNTN